MISKWKRYNPIVAAVLGGSLIYAISLTYRSLFSTGWEPIVVLLALGILLAWHTLKDTPPNVYLPYRLKKPGVEVKVPSPSKELLVVQKSDVVASWVILGVFVLVAMGPFELSANVRMGLSLWLLLSSLVCYLTGIKVAFRTSAALLVFVFMLPIQDTLFLVISQPLRLIATMLSVETLNLFGVEASYELTTISLPKAELGITDACSGIQQFEALLLLGYLLVRWQQNGFWWRLAHYAFITPAIVISNTVRLIVTVVLFNSMGERVLMNDWHEGLGYGQVVLTIILLCLFGIGVNFLSRSSTGNDSGKSSKGGSI